MMPRRRRYGVVLLMSLFRWRFRAMSPLLAYATAIVPSPPYAIYAYAMLMMPLMITAYMYDAFIRR